VRKVLCEREVVEMDESKMVEEDRMEKIGDQIVEL